jgi:hypothetical protein
VSTLPSSPRSPSSRAIVRAALLAVLLATAGCGGSGGEPAPRDQGLPPAAGPAEPAPPAAADAIHHERFRRLATESLRLLIAAAQRELPIGPLQERISAARALAPRDVEAAANRLEEVVTELEALLAAAA